MAARSTTTLETNIEFVEPTDPHLDACAADGWAKLFDLLDRGEVAKECRPSAAGADASSSVSPKSSAPAEPAPAVGDRVARHHPRADAPRVVAEPPAHQPAATSVIVARNTTEGRRRNRRPSKEHHHDAA